MMLAKSSDFKIAELFPSHISRASASVLVWVALSVSALFYQQLKGSECSLYLVSHFAIAELSFTALAKPVAFLWPH